MKKSILLLVSLFAFSLSHAQTVVLFDEDFDGPTNSVTTGSFGGTVTHMWHDTTGISTSPNKSFHVKGSQTLTSVYFETPSFSTVNNPFVRLSFNHIAKLYSANEAALQISTDNGANWTFISTSNSLYLGSDGQFPLTGYWNQGSHQTTGNSPWAATNPFAQPDSTWYIQEIFDLTGIASDTSLGLGNFTGYPNVKIRFIASFNIQVPVNQGFSPGWFVDDIEVLGAPCELSPPQISYNFTPIPCYPNKPQGGIVADPSNSYPIGVQAADTASPFDSGIDSVAVVYRINKSAWDTTGMPYQGSNYEYKGFIPNVLLYDTVDYYVLAWDLGCPNMSRNPETFISGGFYTFWIDSAPPVKCGTPFCNAYPRIILVTDSTEWKESFETGEWVAGTGSGNSTSPPSHRGVFPTYIPWRWQVIPGTPPPPQTPNAFGWSIRQGPTGTPYTGPLGDHTSGGGKYLYVESSHTGGLTYINSPCIDLTRVSGCYGLEFYYHMFGADVNLLAVYVDTGSGSAAWSAPIWLLKDQQQTSSSDPWRRAVVSLEDYVGSIIRLRWLAGNGKYKGINTTNDISIDDLRIFEPDPVEIEVLNTTFPVNGYCSYSAAEPVNITLRNNGCFTAVDIPIAFQVNNNPPVWDTIFNANLGLGEDTINHVFVPGANLSTAPGTYQIKVWAAMPGDVDNTNDTAVGPVINHNLQINSFPYIEDFESETPGSTTLNNTDLLIEDGLNPNLKWTVGTELTTTRNTGPYKGFYWEGNYLYVNSNATTGNVSTYLRTLCFDLSGMTNPTLDFLYHDYAANLQNLVVEYSLDTQAVDQWTTIPGSQITPVGSQELNDWKLKRVSLATWAGQSIKLRFKATRATSAGDRTNFAIDNITVYDIIPSDGGALALKTPGKTGTPNLALFPQVQVANYGSTNLTNYTVNLDITPLCAGTPVTTTYSQTFTTSIPPGGSTTVLMNTANVNWPVGECRIDIYTTVTGDTHNFNDTISRHITGLGDFDIPYKQSFDSCGYESDGFFAGSDGAVLSFLQWERGTPSFGFGPHSSPNSWATNLDGPFITGTSEVLLVPRMDNFDTIVRAQVRFYQSFNFGGSTSPYNAAGTLQYNDGSGWVELGGNRVGLGGVSNIDTAFRSNWFDSPIGDVQVDLFNDKPGWIGSTGGQYKYTKYTVDEYNYQSAKLNMRFLFKSTGTGTPAAGWSIDDFQVYIPPQNSVAPFDADRVNPLPFPFTDQFLKLRVINTGAKVVDTFLIRTYVDGNLLSDPATGNTWQPVSVKKYLPKTKPFTDYRIAGTVCTVDSSYLWPAALVSPGLHQVCLVTSRPNSKGDNYPIDDSSCYTVPVLREIDMTATGDSSFCDGFETPSSLTDWTRLGSDPFVDETGWEFGFPTQVGNAYEGNQAAMTRLDSNYIPLEASGLYSPIFLVDSGQVFELNFWHWFKTEKYHDGGNVEYSLDQGQHWYPIGYSIKGKNNWYNTPFVTALDKIRGGWTDTSGTWINAHQRIAFLDDTKVVFRFRFGADYSLQNAGWAIDDFCIRKSDTAEVFIGDGEFHLPPETIIGELAPNPATEYTELMLNIPTPQTFNVNVYSIVGQQIDSFTKTFEEGVHGIRFNTSTWSNGVYMINMDFGGQTVTRKLVVSH